MFIPVNQLGYVRIRNIFQSSPRYFIILYNYILAKIIDKFITKKRKLDEDEISSNLNIESTSGELNQSSSSSTGLNKIRLYNISYLAMGFTWYGN
jgi:hypothetical protein